MVFSISFPKLQQTEVQTYTHIQECKQNWETAELSYPGSLPQVSLITAAKDIIQC